MNPALGIIVAGFVLAIALGLLARRGRTMDFEQWTVGGRGFGTLLVFLLTGRRGLHDVHVPRRQCWVGRYGRGAPAFYILCYGAIAYTLSYFMLPRDLALCDAASPRVTGGLVCCQVRKPRAGDARRARERRRTDPVSGAAAQGSWQHHIGSVVWDRFRDGRRVGEQRRLGCVCRGVRDTRLRVDRNREGSS